MARTGTLCQLGHVDAGEVQVLGVLIARTEGGLGEQQVCPARGPVQSLARSAVAGVDQQLLLCSDAQRLGEIGKATCRARVLKNRYISVATISLKKTKKNITK